MSDWREPQQGGLQHAALTCTQPGVLPAPPALALAALVQTLPRIMAQIILSPHLFVLLVLVLVRLEGRLGFALLTEGRMIGAMLCSRDKAPRRRQWPSPASPIHQIGSGVMEMVEWVWRKRGSREILRVRSLSDSATCYSPYHRSH